MTEQAQHRHAYVGVPPHERRRREQSAEPARSHRLDAAIAKLDPASRRVYMTLKPGGLKDVAAPSAKAPTIGRIVAALEMTPQRSEWDRIVVVTPTYAATGLEGLPGKLQGPGVFVEPMCQGRNRQELVRSRLVHTRTRPPAGPEATTPDDTCHRVNYFVAPFFYVQVWMLNARTFEVIDHQKVFDSRRCYDPKLGPRQKVSDEFLVAQFAGVIEASVRRAAGDSMLRGQVEVGPVREAPPEAAPPR